MDKFGVTLIAILLMATPVSSGETDDRGLCSREEASGWFFYCDPTREKPVETKDPVQGPEPDPPAPKTATERIMAFRKRSDELKHRAVLEPTEENLRAYMEVNKQIADMAAAFTDQWQRVLFATPHLDANVKYPLTAKGITIYQDQMAQAQKAALLKTAQTNGLLFVYESPSLCGVCEAQAEILANMAQAFGIDILAVSADGAASPSFENAVSDSGQLKTLGLADYPKPLIALVSPDSNAVELVGAGLLTEDQILERIYMITEVPVGERY